MNIQMKTRFAGYCLLWIALTALVGCDAVDAPDAPDRPDPPRAPEPQEPERTVPPLCTENCGADISLPAAVDQRPTVPEVIRVAGNTEVNFHVEAGERDGRTVLSFVEPAFVDENNDPVYTLELGSGDNRYVTRSYDAGVCHPPDGCRYVVINTGQPGRPSIISSPWIIIDQ